ncbi:hypothetical protein [Streptomyces hypolithicus]
MVATPQAQAGKVQLRESGTDGTDHGSAQVEKKKSSLRHLIAGGIAAAAVVVIAGIVIAIGRDRGNRGSVPGGASGGGMGYPNHAPYPPAQHSHPKAVHHQ